MSNLEKLKNIVADHQHQKIDGILVDGSTANLILKIVENLSDANRAKFEEIIESDIKKAGLIAWKLAK